MSLGFCRLHLLGSTDKLICVMLTKNFLFDLLTWPTVAAHFSQIPAIFPSLFLYFIFFCEQNRQEIKARRFKTLRQFALHFEMLKWGGLIIVRLKVVWLAGFKFELQITAADLN